MNRVTRAVPLLAVLAACQDRSVVPTAGRPAFAAAAPAACPTTATVTVSDDAGLRSALAHAAPRALSAILGMISLSQDDTIRNPRATVTRVTPGPRPFALGGS